MEDDFHYFVVRLTHDGERVTRIAAEALRFPWTSCPGAADRLQEMVGSRLAPGSDEPRQRFEISQHCTHMFDIARLAIGQSARGGVRQYDVTIPDRIDGRTQASISRDSVPVFNWDIDGLSVTGPAEFAGHSLAGRAVWPDGSLADADALEAALILRRCIVIFRGRMPAIPTIKRADQVPGGFSTCYTYQPENAASGEWVMEEKDFRFDREPLADFAARVGRSLAPGGKE